MITFAFAALLTAAKPTATELTVYNQGFGFVKEVRSAVLKPGRQTLTIEDVAAMIDPASVGIRSLTDAGSFNVLEQNYQYDLINPEAILNKSVGQRIRFIRTIGTTKDVLDGVLLSSPTPAVAVPNGGNQKTYNGMVIRTDDGRIVLDPSGEVEVQQVPEGLIGRPTLLWELDAQRPGANSVELTYITKGMSWESNYVTTLGSGNTADLQGWVTLNNDSGTTYTNAKLKLLAGDVHQAPSGRMAGVDFAQFQSNAKVEEPKPQFEAQNLFEYHLYTLQRPATVKNKETKQISLLEGHDIPFTKKLIFDWSDSPYSFQSSLETRDLFAAAGQFDFGGGAASQPQTIHPKVKIEFKNELACGLGMPLPKGKFRIYQRDKSGSVQLLGEDQIDHTPKNETVRVVVGQAFDVVGTRKTSNVRIVRNHITHDWFEIELRNRKDIAQKLYVVEHPGDEWRVLTTNQPYTKLDSNSLQFELTLKPNEVRTISYTVEIKE